MRHDLEILKELYLPALQEIADIYPKMEQDIDRGEVFWLELNEMLLAADMRERLSAFISGYGTLNTDHYLAYFTSQRAEFLSYLATYHLSGQSAPTIDVLLQRGDVAFAEEVAFQKDMMAAIAAVGRMELKRELEQAEEHAEMEVSGAEIAAAFSAIEGSPAHVNLREQLQQWEAEEQPAPRPQEQKRKARRIIPLLFFRFAAAAAVCTVGTVGVIKVYNDWQHEHSSTGHYHIEQQPDTLSQPPAENAADTANMTDSLAWTQVDSAVAADQVAPSEEVAAVGNVEHLPHITLKGTIVDVDTKEAIESVLVTMTDDKGKKYHCYSKDGSFQFDLPLHSDLEITGLKDHYSSAHLTLTTKEVKDMDGDDVIEGTLKMSKEK